jgi:hypothetical protein
MMKREAEVQSAHSRILGNPTSTIGLAAIAGRSSDIEAAVVDWHFWLKVGWDLMKSGFTP